MLNSRDFGYAVMSADLKGISFDDPILDTCKKYCFNDSVIAERIPIVNGFSISFSFFPQKQKFGVHKTTGFLSVWVLWFNLGITKNYRYKTGRIVYRCGKDPAPNEPRFTRAGKPGEHFNQEIKP